MKRFFTFFAVCMFVLMPAVVCAQNTHSLDANRLAHILAAKTSQGVDAYLSTPDRYGTPLIIKLARQGDVAVLMSLSQYPSNGSFLLTTDKYGNNLFHVAKNADTVQAIASLIRRFYGADASKQIARLVDARNLLGELPLNAQINAAHDDTFRPIYAYTTLKKKNDIAKTQLSRLYGSDERIFRQNKAIYCRDIVAASSAGGQTLLQAAQTQVAYNPQMAEVARTIQRVIPCLAENTI